MRLLEVRNLDFKVGENIILENISFNVEENGILAIIGPNGAGKTTLVKCILGILEPTNGTVEFKKKNSVGYIPQKLSFDRDFPISVEEFIQIQHKGPLSEADLEIFKTVGVDNLFEQKLGSLSGGEQQRLMIALSLSKNPNIIFMDEPSAGIDIGGEETVYSLIHNLQHKKQFAIVIISHDVDFVTRYADKVICINKRMMCTGKPEKVLTGAVMEEAYGEGFAKYKHKSEGHKHG